MQEQPGFLVKQASYLSLKLETSKLSLPCNIPNMSKEAYSERPFAFNPSREAWFRIGKALCDSGPLCVRKKKMYMLYFLVAILFNSQVKRGHFSIPVFIPTDVQEMIKGMITVDPGKRITVEYLISQHMSSFVHQYQATAVFLTGFLTLGSARPIQKLERES